MDARVEIVVRGVVQGVGFRWHARRQAEALGLAGWVRNEPDGAVRIVAEGPRPALEHLLAWAGQGPSQARVASVVADWQPPRGEGGGFRVRL